MAMAAWETIVDYETAVRMVSTAGDNGRDYLDKLTAAECDARATGAWDANDESSFIAHRSAAAHKRAKMSVVQRFAELRGNVSVDSDERSRLLLRIDDLLRALGAPGDWGYGSKLGELTQILHIQRDALRKKG